MNYENNTQSRKWMLTINNPQDVGLDHDKIMEILQLFRPEYFCMADEIASTGTYHTHVFIYSGSPMRFSTVKKRFPTAHIDKANGSAQENRDYIRKDGKWAETAKAETKVEGTFQEFGTPPPASMENSPKMYQLLQDVKDGFSNIDIINNHPGFSFKIKDIDALRDMLRAEEFKDDIRHVEVYYLYGDTETGKTSGIYRRHPARDICRITDYNPRTGVRFDAYHGQSVLVFEEFHSQIPITDMLNFMDIYPIQLPARYNNRQACYTTIYITSNIPLEDQYPDIQRCQMETWRAFVRRIKGVYEYRRGQPPREVHIDKR